MDVFEQQLEKIKKQFDALTATQKMLVASLVLIMLMTVLFWGKYAGTADMVPLLAGTTLTESDIGPIVSHLEATHIPFTTSAGKVMVPTDRKEEAMASLGYARMLPADTRSAFEDMASKLNPLSPASDRDAMFTHALATEVAKVINWYPNVASCAVIINAKNERTIGPDIEPTASVAIQSKGGSFDMEKLVRAAADTVAHAVSNLKPKNVSVVVDGAPQRVSDGTTLSADDGEKRKLAAEQTREQKLYSLLRIKNISVVVNCSVNISTESVRDLDYKEPGHGSVQWPTHSIEQTEETNTQPATGREPGPASNLQSNGTAAVGDGGVTGGTAQTSNKSTTTTDTDMRAGTHAVTRDTPAGGTAVVSAAVNVPDSYLLETWKARHGKAKEPTDAELTEWTTAMLARIQKLTEGAIGATDETKIAISAYPDVAMATTEPLVAASTTAITNVTGHAKEIAISVLATVALFMLATFVRRGGATTAAPQLAGLGGATGAAAVGGTTAAPIDPRVIFGMGPLEGMEVDDETVRTQQMLEQVTAMVKENPDGAAALVKRWLARP